MGDKFDSSDQGSFDPSVFSACATVSGYLPRSGNLDVICDPPLEGRYLTVHMHGVTAGTIQLCEVVVYDHPGNILFQYIDLVAFKPLARSQQWKQQVHS